MGRLTMLLSPLRFLPLEPAQLSLAATLKCGQTFLWRRGRAIATLPENGEGSSSGGFEWSYGHRDRTIVLRQDASGIHYRSLFPIQHAAAHAEDLQRDTTLDFLRKYFVLDVSLPSLYAFWSDRDANFRKKTSGGTRYGGIRILRQPAWECVIEFICSSNNNIGRIEGMLRRLLKLYGVRLPCPADLDATTEPIEEDEIYAFPEPRQLLGNEVTASLRSAGFGYRDAYVTKTAALAMQLAEEAGYKSPMEWLESVSLLSEEQAKETLLCFAGVGPKVADCILLFGLGFEDVVPVDTHVYQIAVRDYGLKGSKDATVSKAIYVKVREKLKEAWGQKAGWAQQVLFTADLKSFADFEDPLLASPISASAADAIKALVAEELDVKIKLEDDDSGAVSATPLGKRRRVASAHGQISQITPTRRRMPANKVTPVKQEVLETSSKVIYPTPPETPLTGKLLDADYFGESPLSLAERVKRTRRTVRL